MRTNPVRERVFFFDLARSKLQGREHTGLVVDDQFPAIEIEEQFEGNEGRTLVAIHERMITRKSERTARRQCGCIRCVAEGPMLWPIQRGSQKTLVAQAGRPTVLDKLLIVNGADQRGRQPYPRRVRSAHLASSRRTLRRFFMIRLAASICWLKTSS